MREIVLKYLEDKGVNVVRIKDDEVLCHCPLPGHIDRTPSFALNLKKSTWICFACNKAGHFYNLVCILESTNIPRAIGYIEKVYGFTGLEVPEFYAYEVRYVEKGLAKLPEVLAFYRQLVERNRGLDAPLVYLERGLDGDDWKLWGGVRTEYALFFPIFNKFSKFRGLVQRGLIAGGSMYDPLGRWINISGSKPKSTVYGMDKVVLHNSVIVVEGLFDTHKVYSAVGDKHDVVGLLGASFSVSQVKDLCSTWDEIYVWLDNDTIGNEVAEKLYKVLLNKGKRVGRIPYKYPIKDQGCKEFTHDMIKYCVARRRLFFYDVT